MPPAPKCKPTQSADLSLEQFVPPPPPPPFTEGDGLEGHPSFSETADLNKGLEDEEGDEDYTLGPSQ
jgi:hypothetical protein